MLQEYFKASFPLIYIQSYEYSRVREVVLKEAEEIGYGAYEWDVAEGLRQLQLSSPLPEKKQAVDPIAMVDQINKLPEGSIVLASNFHLFLNRHNPNPQLIQKIQNLAPIWKATARMLVVSSPVINLPVELEKMFTIVNIPLASPEDFKKIIKRMISDTKGKVKMPTKAEMEKLTEAGRGLTEFEFENAIALSLIKYRKCRAEVVMEMKQQLVKKSEVLSYYIPSELDSFKYIGGMENVKDFCTRIIKSDLYRGILMLGVQGTGKSAFGKALGKEVGLPLVMMDMSKIYGSLLGESEQKMANALQVIQALNKCIVFIDEIEKGLSGVASSHLTDGGTGARVGQQFLVFMNDRPSGNAFVIASCNDISKLPPEYLRAERWDAIFFSDLPSLEERKIIWKIWGDYYKVDYKKIPIVNGEPMDLGWTGAEIKTCCRIAKALSCSIEEAGKYIIPVSRSRASEIERLREWAKDKTIPASIATSEEVVPKLSDYRKIDLMEEVDKKLEEKLLKKGEEGE